MRLRPLALLFAASLAASAASAQQTLVCSTSPAGQPCGAFHFHVQLWRPDTKQFVEVTGVNQFATQAACERARELHVTTNAKAVDYLRGIRKQYEPDRAGPCHCDMTHDKAAPDYLTPAQRVTHVRQLEETRLRLRERLLDEKLTSESEIVSALWAEPPSTPQLAGPKFAPLPRSVPAPLLTATEDLRSTKTLDTTKPVVAALDLPLIDLAPDAPAPPPLPVESASDVPMPATEEVRVDAPAETEAVQSEAIESTVPEEDVTSAQETAERFVAYEKERIQNVLRASASITDEAVKSKIFEAAMQRIQLLSNLRLLIEGSGMRSRLAAAARNANDESGRLALIGQLFGEELKAHWAPRDAADVILEIEPAIAAEPERALRDTTGDVSTQQKKRALYLVLAQTQPTEDQLLWLTSVVEEFLR